MKWLRSSVIHSAAAVTHGLPSLPHTSRSGEKDGSPTLWRISGALFRRWANPCRALPLAVFTFGVLPSVRSLVRPVRRLFGVIVAGLRPRLAVQSIIGLRLKMTSPFWYSSAQLDGHTG